MKNLPKFRYVKGKNLTNKEVSDWSPEKTLSFLKFCEFFMKTKDGKETWDITLEKRKNMEAVADEVNTEFLARIDCPTWNADSSPGKFMFKINSCLRVLLGWLKNNPHLLTLELKEKMKTNSRFVWALEPFKVNQTLMQIPTVELNNRSDARLTTPEVQYNQAMLKMSSVFRSLVEGIKVSDIKNMDTKDKLKIAVSMAPVLSKAFSQYKPNKFALTQINIHASRKEDLERAMLDYHNESQK